jgi:hypothetical protein
MTGDFSRRTFSPEKDYSLVRMQQGRLFSDADWNEQGDILRASQRWTTADVIGHAGFPDDDAGFALIPDPNSGALVITPGTGYVAGVRHVVRPPEAFQVARVSGTGTNAVWRIETGPALANGDLLTTDPEGLSGFVEVEDFAEAQDGSRTFRTAPALNSVDGRVVKPTLISRQPYGAGAALPTTAGDYLAVLKSTEVAVTALDDPLIREVAFDGPDTAIRDRTTWQVFLVSRTALLGLGYQAADLTCPALADGLDPVIGQADRGLLRAQAKLSDLSAGPCTLPPAAGYRSLDNLLYRVQIVTSGDETSATYVWSRENAIHRTRYREIDAGVLVVDSVGRDETTALKSGDWIEIRDQHAIYGETPGFFARIDDVVGQRVALAEILDPVTLTPLLNAGLPDTDKLPPAAFLTRWEGGPPQAVADALTTWTDLENGVQVWFEAGAFQTGDHWTIPGRAVSGDVEWPRDPFTKVPVAKLPEGPRRHYAALAWLNRAAGGWTVTEDCRPLFPPLIDSEQFLYAGGDGQEALPDPLSPNTRVALPEALSAAVVRGDTPIAGETIRFAISAGDGRLGNGQTVQEVQTDAQGNASVTWSLDATTLSQRVIARRLDAAGTPTHHAIAYNATLARAAETSYDPTNTPALAGAKTVQEAIEALAGLQQIGCTTHIIEEGADWVTVLEGLQPNENASICFARGVYKTSRTVRMKGFGHIRISGAGPTTAQIIANRVEAALAFEDCDSVSVSGLEIATPDANSVVPDSDDTHRLGTLDFGHCDHVDVHDCLLRCGGGTSPQRTCLSVRGWSESLGSFRATKSVRVVDNRFSVGNLQEAVVVTDAIDVNISNNDMSVRPRKTGSFRIDAFLADKTWLAKVSKSLVARPVKGKLGAGSGFREIAGKQWRMTFNSPVPQKDWDELVTKTPPSSADLASEAAFTSYTEGLINSVSSDPSLMPAFDKQLERVRTTFGTGSQRFDAPEVRRSLLVSSEPSVHRFDAATGSPRQVVIEANGQVASFDSPFSQADWNRIIARSEEAPKVANADELLGLSYALAKEVVVNPGMRNGLGSVENWLKGLVDNGVSLGMQAIVCAGRRLDNVQIRGNVIREFQVGIRVAPSHERNKDVRAQSVRIDDNKMDLLAENAEAYAGYGMMVGNVETLRIRGNDMMLSSKPNYTRYFAQGIRIWGFIGYQVLVAENRIEMATMGIRLNAVDADGKPPKKNYLWVFRENLFRGPKGTVEFKASPSGVVRENDNLLREDL